MAAVRQLAEKSARDGGENIREAWEASVQPVIDLLRARFERLKLKGVPVCI